MGPVYILAAALVVAFIAFLGIKLARMISREGFETMKTTDEFLALGSKPLSSICPNNGALISRISMGPNIDKDTAVTILSKLTNPASLFESGLVEVKWSCYSPGVSNVNSIFQTDPNTSPSAIGIYAPKGSIVDLYTEKDAKGNLIKSLNDSTSSSTVPCPRDGICSDYNNYRNIQFSSVKIIVPSTNPSGRTKPSASCPTLSPAAAAAAAAVEAKEEATKLKAAAIADATSKVISDNIVNSIEDSESENGNLMNVSCPSGEKPSINFMRNTKNVIPQTKDINTLKNVRATNPDQNNSESSPAPSGLATSGLASSGLAGSGLAPIKKRGTGGGYNFDPSKEC